MNLDVASGIVHDPDNGIFGDCVRCCVACILDKSLEDVPHFFYDGCGGVEGTDRLRKYLATQGLGLVVIPWDGDMSMEAVMDIATTNFPGVPYVLTGASGRLKGVGHSVVGLNDRIVFDSSGSGLSGPLDGYWWVEVFSPLA